MHDYSTGSQSPTVVTYTQNAFKCKQKINRIKEDVSAGSKGTQSKGIGRTFLVLSRSTKQRFFGYTPLLRAKGDGFKLIPGKHKQVLGTNKNIQRRPNLTDMQGVEFACLYAISTRQFQFVLFNLPQVTNMGDYGF